MDRQLSFLKEIDKLKNVLRRSPLLDKSRRENSAEHSWHLALYAMVLSSEADSNVNIDRVIRMLLIHDIVEIDAGDHPIHEASDAAHQAEQELKAAKRIFGLLPEQQRNEFIDLWLEFEAGESNDAAFAKSLDRLQPLIHNVSTGGGTWVESNVTEDEVHKRYGPSIRGGSAKLWNKAQELVEKHFQQASNKT